MKARAAAGEDLEALFDRIATETAVAAQAVPAAAPARVVAPPAPGPAPAAAVAATPPAPAAAPSVAHIPDTDDLEALFDQVAAERIADIASAEAMAPAAAGDDRPADDAAMAEGGAEANIFQRVGQLTRTLHEALRELGYDKALEKSVSSLPDTRDRLAYIATLTGQAADKVLGAVEQGQVLQQGVAADAKSLARQWERVYAGEITADAFAPVALATRDFLQGMAPRVESMQGHLHTIMMAQDFHDLTGQVIKRVVDVAQMLESNLVALLVETRQMTDAHHEPMLSGPQVVAGRSDVVTGQAQVDELLESLGF